MVRIVPFLVAFFCAASLLAEEPKPMIIPKPLSLVPLHGSLPLKRIREVRVWPDTPDVVGVGYYLADRLAELGVTRPRVLAAQGPAQGAITLDASLNKPDLGPESYSLEVATDQVKLQANTSDGLFWGVQSLRQLAPLKGAPRLLCVKIVDRSRFGWRGMLFDCCRHFMPKEFVKRQIDLLALHKMNVLHWHLTEDQGWRIEIKKYPKLTEVGAWRGDDHYGGFYTQDDVREVVAYAASRHITVVPEIEMPGHSVAALAAYPELSCTGGPFKVATGWGIFEDVYCAGNEKTFEFIEDVLAEVISLFPSRYIHIGGDECPKERWHACPKCQARMKAEGLPDEHALQSYFIRRIEKFLESKGKRLIGWDEILEGGLAPGATVQSWRGEEGGIAAAKQGHDVIMSPYSHCYLDWSHEATTLEKSYSYEPIPAALDEEEAKHVMGGQGNMWTEHAPPELIDRQVFPRLCALSEVFWSAKQLRDWPDFRARYLKHSARLTALGVTYFVPRPKLLTPTETFIDQTVVKLAPFFPGDVVRYTLDGSAPNADSPKYTGPLALRQTTELKAVTVDPTGRVSEPVVKLYTRQQPAPPYHPKNTKPGLDTQVFEGDWKLLPDYTGCTPVAKGVATTIDLKLAGKRDRYFGMRFTGYLNAPNEGVYRFYLTADDGARLWIDDQLVVDNAGPHEAIEGAGSIALQAGAHLIRVDFIQTWGGQALSLEWEGPGLKRRTVAGKAFCRE